MNDVSLIGRLTRDPELIMTDKGVSIANLRVAVDRRARDDEPLFVTVKCFQAQARACAEHLEKGRQVGITGRLERDEWLGEDGSNRERYYVVAQGVEFLARRSAESGPDRAGGDEADGSAGF